MDFGNIFVVTVGNNLSFSIFSKLPI
jgi:hypothetical protein